VSTVDEAWRVIFDQQALAEAAAQGERVVRSLEAAESACTRVWQSLGDELPQAEGAYQAARQSIQGAEGLVRDAAVRLRHIAG
jgi:hypothetical protein